MGNHWDQQHQQQQIYALMISCEIVAHKLLSDLQSSCTSNPETRHALPLQAAVQAWHPLLATCPTTVGRWLACQGHTLHQAVLLGTCPLTSLRALFCDPATWGSAGTAPL